MAAKKGLGKGLDSLITDKVSKPVKPKSNHAADAVMIDINKVEPNREQPRKKFDEDALIYPQSNGVCNTPDLHDSLSTMDPAPCEAVPV